ncbi:putative sulfate exporter family transporter [Selenomonas sp. WCA-380-WT-3B 3/]|uniref:Putative sulfate exporter family transporter n=1 Tax=Selenomonas montiformis TaxID=2652285 RepID=A0A6I2UYF5_9FIRM|nr:putative sulfate exporter family transporter [Selenomonas montiformis]MSV25124.1 putative sulfate exporter family transporter [Selenomonas montiformis]
MKSNDYLCHARRLSTGFALTLGCSIAGWQLASFPGFSLVGSLVIALLLGMMFQIIRPLSLAAQESTPFIANRFLRAGIILLGFKLNLVLLMGAGLKSLAAAALIVTVMILLNYGTARLFRVNHTLALLSACGCSICGAAAVMGVSSAVRAKTDESVLAVAIVAILGTVFTLIEVGLQPFLGFSPEQFGVMAGLSLHEIAHAVAAGGSAGAAGTDSAIIAKLSRVLLLAPVAVLIGLLEARRNRRQDSSFTVPIPYFMGGFILASAIGSYIPLPDGTVSFLVQLAYLLLGMAMAALGLNVRFSVILHQGVRPLTAAFLCSIVITGLAWSIVSIWF